MKLSGGTLGIATYFGGLLYVNQEIYNAGEMLKGIHRPRSLNSVYACRRSPKTLSTVSDLGFLFTKSDIREKG